MFDVFFYGDDQRFSVCKNKLKHMKINSKIINNKIELEGVNCPRIIVFPFQGINELSSFDEYILNEYKNSLFIIYNSTSIMKEYIDKNNLKTLNLKDLDDFSKLNNVASSEPTLKYIIENLPYNFKSLNVAILGYGKYGKELAKLYEKLDMKVDIYVRRKIIKDEIGNNGYLLEELENNITKYNLIVNTIPFNVINDNLLHKISLDTLLLDVSSYPYGWNHETAKYLGLNTIFVKAIPSVYRYKEIGNSLAETIRKCLNK